MAETLSWLQLCQAYRNDEHPQTVVVMSQRPKLEMEETFRNIIPEAVRYGTKFVFRCAWFPTVRFKARRAGLWMCSSGQVCTSFCTRAAPRLRRPSLVLVLRRLSTLCPCKPEVDRSVTVWCP